MAQHDYTIANQGFPATRSDINNVLSAISTNNSGTSAPSTQYAGQFWIDTTTSTWTMYIHDGTDDIQFATIDTSANTINFTDSALDVVTDTTPQLGGNLDLNSNDITGTGDINITGTITASGNIDFNADLDVSGVSTFSAGTVSLPSISTTGDTNTGIFFPSADTIAFTEGGTEAMRINSDGSVTKPVHPAFRAKITSTVSNVTGDGTYYSMNTSIWSEIYDQGANFNPTTGTFTAPVTGKYTFTIMCTLAGISTATHTQGLLYLNASNRSTKFTFHPGNNRDLSLGGGSQTLTTDVDMDASDTLSVQVYVAGGSKTVDIWPDTTLTGHLIC